MKAYDILEQATMLASGTSPDQMLKKAGVGFINTILNDLNQKSIQSLSDEISFDRTGGCTVLVNGVSMLICLFQGDDAGLSGFNEVYNSGRKRFISNVSRIKNSVFGGGEA